MQRVKVLPISEARPNLTALVEEVAQSREPYFIATHSKVKAVLLGVEEYNTLLEQIEELEDSLDILKARVADEPTTSFAEFVRELEEEQQRNVQRRA
jgi:prevent-host-death family protein